MFMKQDWFMRQIEELAAQDFTREELWDGLHEVMALYGVHIPGL